MTRWADINFKHKGRTAVILRAGEPVGPLNEEPTFIPVSQEELCCVTAWRLGVQTT